jgi:hypothetical protein
MTPGHRITEKLQGVTVKQLLDRPKFKEKAPPVFVDILERYQAGVLPKCSPEDAEAILQRYLNGEPEPPRIYESGTPTILDQSRKHSRKCAELDEE